MVDSDSSYILHSTYARILVDLDASKGLPTKIRHFSPKASWIQMLHYEGLPFRCREYFKIGHVVEKCDIKRVKSKKPSSLWKGASS